MWELRALLLAAGKNLAAQRRDGRAAGPRRELCFTQLLERVLIGSVAQPCCFYLFEHVDGFRSRVDELGGIASKSGFQIREDTNNSLGTTPIAQLRCDVCCSQSGAHHGQRDQHAIPSVAM